MWNIDWAWFDASGGRVRWLSVIDPGTGMAAEQLVPRFTEAAHPGRDATEQRTAQRSDRQLVHGTSRLEPSRRRTRRRRAPPRQHVNMGPRLARVRSGFVPETRAKSAEFAGIRFSSVRRRRRRNIAICRLKNRLDDANSAACHTEGRALCAPRAAGRADVRLAGALPESRGRGRVVAKQSSVSRAARSFSSGGTGELTATVVSTLAREASSDVSLRPDVCAPRPRCDLDAT